MQGCADADQAREVSWNKNCQCADLKLPHLNSSRRELLQFDNGL
jgi:hypothetical protein